MFFFSYKTMKGFPLLNKMNKIIRRLQEGGFIKKWDKDVSFYPNNDTSRKVKSLKMSHMQTVFYLYVIGLIIAVFAFCIELFYWKCSKSVKCNNKL